MRYIIIFTLLFSFHQTIGQKNKVCTVSNTDLCVRFYLYTRQNPNDPQEVFVNNTQILSESLYNVNRISKFIAHGWKNSGSSDVSLVLKAGFLAHADYNVFVIDWGEIAKNASYGYAASRVQDVGKLVAGFVNFIIRQGSDPNEMSLVGHSLGAQVMGIAGKYTSKEIAHLVGLDPARPGFIFTSTVSRITKQDAHLVEIIHTSDLGYYYPEGNIDYYPNGGEHQPGCGTDYSGSCSHSRSYEYYAESLTNPNNWFAIRCETYTLFKSGKCNGNIIVPFARWSANFTRPDGVYMLRTRSHNPYGLGYEGVQESNKFSLVAIAESFILRITQAIKRLI